MAHEKLVGNAADPKQVKSAKRIEQARSDRERADLQTVLGSEQGRREYWKQLSEAGLYRLSYVHGDSHATAFNEGRRNQGLALLLRIQQLDPTMLYRMAKEAADLEQMERGTQQKADVSEEQKTSLTEETDDGN